MLLAKRRATKTKATEATYRTAAQRLELISHPVRLFVLLRLGDFEQNVATLRSETPFAETGFSKHLAFLRHAGLIEPRRDGQRVVYALTDVGHDMRTLVLALGG